MTQQSIHARRVRGAILSLPETLAAGPVNRVNRRVIPRTDEIVGWAPTREIERVCQSREGRWRRAHEWDRDDTCCYCDSRRAE
jgi:hypothetical protein